MATKQNTSPEPITPQVGQVLYNEYIDDSDGSFKFGSLLFVDSPIEEGAMWNYTQLAHMEDFGDGMEVSLEQEAGGMPATVTRVATDEDIKKFIQSIPDTDSEKSQMIQAWLEWINNDEVLLQEEKQRIADLVK